MNPWCRHAAFVVALTLVPHAAVAADSSTASTRASTTASAVVGADAKVNINTATVKELQTLSGIGARVAERIVAHREAHGPFRKAEDLRKVEGVTKTVWERNRARIAVK